MSGIEQPFPPTEHHAGRAAKGCSEKLLGGPAHRPQFKARAAMKAISGRKTIQGLPPSTPNVRRNAARLMVKIDLGELMEEAATR
jgi:hypothetical protein